MLLLSDHEVARAIDMSSCIDAMERAFADFHASEAVNRPRLRYTSRTPDPNLRYFANIHAGAVPAAGVAAVRLGTNLIGAAEVSERRELLRASRWNWDLILLYDLSTAGLLAIMPASSLSPIRVAATSGLAARHLANPMARSAAILGTGRMARDHLRALRAVRAVTEFRVFSPSPAHREDFARSCAGEGYRVVPVVGPQEAVRGADLVCCATNSMHPVFFGSWFEPGQLLISIENSDVTHIKTEVDREAIVASDVVVINDRESVQANHQRELLDPVADGELAWEHIHELGELAAGAWACPWQAEQRVYYKNNTGMAIQFAVAGCSVVQSARRLGIGRELPAEWFGADLAAWHAKGY